MLDAAFAELTEHGYESTTMLGVARRAGASKETLYSWFGNKEGLFAALIRRQASATVAQVAHALADGSHVAGTLTAVAQRLLQLLLGDRAVAINRAAMASPTLATLLLQHGRYAVGPLVEQYLARLAAEGRLIIDDPAEAFGLFYGLVIRDLQIRVLLGEPAPTPAQLREQAHRAVERFLALNGGSGGDR